jgi:hypothetical protein
VSDRGGMALSEANLKPLVRVCSTLLSERTRTPLSGGSSSLLADGRQTGSAR